jgi:hypothetical protein
MSTSREILAVYHSEIRYPSDIINNGKQYIQSRKPLNPVLRRALNKVRDKVVTRDLFSKA